MILIINSLKKRINHVKRQVENYNNDNNTVEPL